MMGDEAVGAGDSASDGAGDSCTSNKRAKVISGIPTAAAAPCPAHIAMAVPAALEASSPTPLTETGSPGEDALADGLLLDPLLRSVIQAFVARGVVATRARGRDQSSPSSTRTGARRRSQPAERGTSPHDGTHEWMQVRPRYDAKHPCGTVARAALSRACSRAGPRRRLALAWGAPASSAAVGLCARSTRVHNPRRGSGHGPDSRHRPRAGV